MLFSFSEGLDVHGLSKSRAVRMLIPLTTDTTIESSGSEGSRGNGKQNYVQVSAALRRRNDRRPIECVKLLTSRLYGCCNETHSYQCQ
jgi:hypothetical protein